MSCKAAGQEDYVICKLETLWFTPDGGVNPDKCPQEQWCWKLLIRTP